MVCAGCVAAPVTPVRCVWGAQSRIYLKSEVYSSMFKPYFQERHLLRRLAPPLLCFAKSRFSNEAGLLTPRLLFALGHETALVKQLHMHGRPAKGN